MAARRGGGLKHVHRLLAPGANVTCPAGDDFDESDVWGLAPEPRKTARAARVKPDKLADRAAPLPPPTAASVAASLPVNIPDWSKILRHEHRVNGGGGGSYAYDDEDDEGGEGNGAVIPPHELLCRSRAASFSVHEGIGRTLKGRDLSRVRDAVWQQTGFED